MSIEELVKLAIEYVGQHGGTIVVENIKITVQSNGVIFIMFNV